MANEELMECVKELVENLSNDCTRWTDGCISEYRSFLDLDYDIEDEQGILRDSTKYRVYCEIEVDMRDYVIAKFSVYRLNGDASVFLTKFTMTSSNMFEHNNENLKLAGELISDAIAKEIYGNETITYTDVDVSTDEPYIN